MMVSIPPVLTNWLDAAAEDLDSSTDSAAAVLPALADAGVFGAGLAQNLGGSGGDITDSWAQVIEAFIAGQVNVVHLLALITIWARFGSKVPAKVVAWNHVDGSGLTVLPEIGGVKDLGGKTPFWYSIHNVVLQALLRDAGLKPVIKRSGQPAADEVKLIVMAPPDMPPALASKQIAGYIVAEPFNAAAEQLGIGKVLRFTGDVWKNHACCVVFMHEDDLNQRADWSQKVVNAVVKAQVFARENRAETAAILSKEGPHRYTPQPKAVLTKVLAPAADAAAIYERDGAIKHADWHQKRIDFQPYPYPSYTEELVRRLKQTEIDGDKTFLAALDPAFAARDLVDDRFVEKGHRGCRRLQDLRLAGRVCASGNCGHVTGRLDDTMKADKTVDLTACHPLPASKSRSNAAWSPVLLGLLGIAGLFALWFIGTDLLPRSGSFVRRFSPVAAFASLADRSTGSPGVMGHVLTGIRLAIGICWIVLVPCEMLGVSAGLGYLVFDTRDRLAYSEPMAVVMVIGVIGFALDGAARGLHWLWKHR